MCFPQTPAAAPVVVQQAPAPPSRSSAAVERRVQDVRQPTTRMSQTVLTSPLGDPNFGKNISRTVLSGVLT